MTCCSENAYQEDEFMITFHSYSSAKESITVFLSHTLNNKIGFVYLYTGDNDLVQVNEIKKDKNVFNVLCSYYREYYYNKSSSFAKNFQLHTQMQWDNVVAAIVVEKEGSELSSKWVIDVLKDDHISCDALRKLILRNQYRNTKVTTEPSNTLTPNEPITEIAFRLPNGNSAIKRKFKTKDTISSLYSFVKSKANEIFSEDKISTQFKLVIPHPYKQLTMLSNTIEEEHLFPNALIQIEEAQ